MKISHDHIFSFFFFIFDWIIGLIQTQKLFISWLCQGIVYICIKNRSTKSNTNLLEVRFGLVGCHSFFFVRWSRVSNLNKGPFSKSRKYLWYGWWAETQWVGITLFKAGGYLDNGSWLDAYFSFSMSFSQLDESEKMGIFFFKLSSHEPTHEIRSSSFMYQILYVRM